MKRLLLGLTLAAGLAGMEEKLAPTAAMDGNAYDHSHDLARTFLAAHDLMQASRSAPRLLGKLFVEGFLSVKELEYDSYLREICAWERRFLLPAV